MKCKKKVEEVLKQTSISHVSLGGDCFDLMFSLTVLLLQLRLSLYATLLIKFRGERHVYRRADVNLQTKHLTVQTLLLHLSPWTLPGSVNLLRGQFV